jgi:SAM-dependent methyltransferase
MKEILKSVLTKNTRVSLRRAFYAGFRYHCPLCGSHLRTMFDSGLPFSVLRDVDIVGGERIPRDICPVCFSQSRTRLMWAYLRKEVRLEERNTKPKVLHVAPEHPLMVYLSGLSEYVGVDIDPRSYDSHGRVEYCDITNIAYPDNTFDLIICSHVLEHVPRDAVAIKELRRVLRPDGIAILQVPIGTAINETIEDLSITDPRERERRFGQHDHVRIYGPDYPQRLAAGGFVVEIFDPVAHWGTNVASAMRLNRRERLFVGRKELNGPATERVRDCPPSITACNRL